LTCENSFDESQLFDESPHNKSLDASGGGVFRNLIHPAEGALIRAAASTQPFGVFSRESVCRKWRVAQQANMCFVISVTPAA
jgi:hypothetical protein